MRHRLLSLCITASLVACSGNDLGGRTIADLEELEELPPIIESVEAEPSVDFSIDRQQVIDSFRQLVEITEHGGGTGDEMRRLADLELEQSLDLRAAGEDDAQQTGEAEAHRAISIYEEYLQRYPDRENNDAILYQLSRAYAVEARPEKSLNILNRIARDYPESKYIDEVQFRRGESLFVTNDYAAAESAYSHIIEHHPQSQYYDKALYKYGWTQFKQSRYEDALNSYLEFLDRNFEQGNILEIDYDANLSRADRELLEDVVRVIALGISYQEEEGYITRYFRTAGQRDYEPLIYRGLGELYLDTKRLVDGSGLFLTYTREYPNSPHSPYFHQRAIETYQLAGYSDLVLQEKIAFVDRYDVSSEYWMQQDQPTREKIKPTLVTHMTELAQHYHALARKSRQARDYQVSADWYRRFLKSFADDPQAPRMNFLLAESLYDSGQYPQAIDEYQRSAYAYDTHADSAEAGYAALIAFDALFKRTNASDVPALRRKRIESAVRFTTSFPKDPRIAAVELQSAQQFFAWKEFQPAIEAATRLIENPGVDDAIRQTAWSIRADAQFSSEDYPAAEESYLALLKLMPPDDRDRPAVREQVAASIYKQGELALEAEQLEFAAVHFTRLGQVIPESPKRRVADYDAASVYLRLENWPEAIARLEAFRRQYPKDQQFNVGVAEKLALAYSRSGSGTLAAREMMTLTRLPGDSERKRDLMWRAAELFQEAGEEAEAIAIYKTYVAAYPYPLDRSMELRHKIAESYRAEKDTRQLRYWLQEIVAADAAAGQTGRSDRSRYLAATASLELTEPLHRSYQKARLTVPLKTSLRQKKQLMEKSIDAYTRAMKYQVQEVTTEATFKIAEIYHEFARSLMGSERPKGLSEDQLEEYDLLLEEQAYPFEEKAIDIHLANFKRIPAGTYDEPTRKSLQILGELMPFRFARVESTDVYVEIQ